MYFSLVASALRCAVLCFLSTLLCLPTNCRWPTRVTGSSVTSGRQTSWLPALVNNPYRSVTDSEPTRVPSLLHLMAVAPRGGCCCTVREHGPLG